METNAKAGRRQFEPDERCPNIPTPRRNSTQHLWTAPQCLPLLKIEFKRPIEHIDRNSNTNRATAKDSYPSIPNRSYTLFPAPRQSQARTHIQTSPPRAPPKATWRNLPKPLHLTLHAHVGYKGIHKPFLGSADPNRTLQASYPALISDSGLEIVNTMISRLDKATKSTSLQRPCTSIVSTRLLRYYA